MLFGDNQPFLDSTDIRSYINTYYDSIVSALQQSSCVTVPVKKKGFYKYWWDEELTLLKEKAMQSFNVWASLGKPRNGMAFDEKKGIKLLINMPLKKGKRQQGGILRQP